MINYVKKLQREIIVDRILNNRERRRCFKFNKGKWKWW